MLAQICSGVAPECELQPQMFWFPNHLENMDAATIFHVPCPFKPLIKQETLQAGQDGVIVESQQGHCFKYPPESQP